METLRCKECGELYPFTSEYYYKQKGSKGGLRKICKICFSKETKKHLQENNYYYKPTTIAVDGERVRLARYTKGLTQESMSRELDISIRTYRNIEIGKTKKTAINTYNKICELLDLKSDE